MFRDIKVIKSLKRRKTIVLQITAAAKVIVRAPRWTSDRTIQTFVDKKQVWIEKKRAEIQRANRKQTKRKFIDGEGFLYLGRNYKLYLINKSSSHFLKRTPFYFKNAFYLHEDKKDQAKEFFINWYKKQAQKYIRKRVDKYSQENNFAFNKVKISWAKKRWGSCTPKNNLNFNWRLIMAPVEVVDYIVVHELVHLKYHHHAPKFWRHVKVIMPDYKKREKWLKTNYQQLSFLL